MNWQKIGFDALTGLIAAAAIDFQAFRTWKSFRDAFTYNWSLALWRWFQGAVIGATAGYSIGAITQ